MTTNGRPRRSVIGFAHRGARSERQENTIAAFERAIELGATGLESDAWLTADGVAVLDHDGVVGPLWRRRPLSTTVRADLPSHVPTLEDLYRHCGADFELSLDIKDPAVLEPVLAAARAAGGGGRLWLCYHDWRLMAPWRAIAPECRLVESTNIHWMGEGLGAHVSALAAAGIDAVNLHRTQWDHDRVREVRAAGLYCLAWDVQTAEELAETAALGVDGVYSDHVERMVNALRAPGRDGGS